MHVTHEEHTTIAVTMNTTVAAIERGDSRAIPQTPWPEVQPPPSRVPNPISSPAPTITDPARGHLRQRQRRAGQRANQRRGDKPGDERKPPVAVVRARQRDSRRHMPLIPAMRPVSSINSAAERPIKAPPISAETGVKFVMTDPISLTVVPSQCSW